MVVSRVGLRRQLGCVITTRHAACCSVPPSSAVLWGMVRSSDWPRVTAFLKTCRATARWRCWQPSGARRRPRRRWRRSGGGRRSKAELASSRRAARRPPYGCDTQSDIVQASAPCNSRANGCRVPRRVLAWLPAAVAASRRAPARAQAMIIRHVLKSTLFVTEALLAL